MNNPHVLGTERVGKLLVQFSIPAIISMTIVSLYNIIDSVFIGHGVGPMAIAGLAITFPMMNLMAAFGNLVAAGGATISSIKLGQKDMQGATDVLGSVWTRDRAYYTEQVGKIAEMAGRYNLNYNVEFLPWAGMRNLQEGITLVESLKVDNLFLMVDMLHAGRAGVTAEELARTDRKYFRFLHLCDGPAGPDGDPVLANINDELMVYTAREGRLYPGEGAMDVAGMVAALPVIPVSIELPNLKRMEELGAEGHARRCLETAKAYFAANGL